jgi:GNAT superfamily N-acetyltransferase
VTAVAPLDARVRPAAPADVPAIHAMIGALARYEKLDHLHVASEADVAQALFGERPVAEALVCDADGAPVAFAVYFEHFSTFLGRPGLWLEDLFVLPAHRGRGVGKALLRALAAIAVERGCGRFEWAVLDWNAPAIEFYRGLGASVLPDWRIVRLVGPALDALAGRPA